MPRYNPPVRSTMLFPCDEHRWGEWVEHIPMTSNFDWQANRSCPDCGAREVNDGYRIRFYFGGEHWHSTEKAHV